MRFLVIALVSLSLPACSLFCPGPSECLSQGAVVVRVVDGETKAPLGDAEVLASTGGETPATAGNCPYEGDGGRSNCRALPEPGNYHLTVRAAGYVDTELDVEAQRDVCGNLASQIREIGLQKVGSAVKPLVNSSEACGG